MDGKASHLLAQDADEEKIGKNTHDQNARSHGPKSDHQGFRGGRKGRSRRGGQIHEADDPEIVIGCDHAVDGCDDRERDEL